MSENLKLLRFYFWMLGLFTLGRWGLSLGHADYSKTTGIFSLVTLAFIGSAHHAAFARAFRSYSFWHAVTLGLSIGVATQIVIWVSTAVSYGLGMQTFFNEPAALNVKEAIPFGQAMVARTITFVVNSLFNGIAAAIGFAMGGALPRSHHA